MTVNVIGAGLSGLATAWYLTERGARVHVREAGSRPGGLIQTVHTPEGLVETAARAFTWSERTGDLFKAAGVMPAFAREESKRRYILRNGTPKRWPLTPLETARTGMRFASAWIRRQVRPRRTETVAQWGQRVFGASATTWLLAPALQGIYAAPPNELSAAALFGIGRTRGKLVSPPKGMGELISRLYEGLQSRGVTFEFDAPATATDLDRADATVISTNAPAAARLLAPHAPALASAIGRIRMVSVVVVTAFYAPHANDLRGFGILFPRSAGIDALGALFNAEIFEGRSALRSETWIFGDVDAARLPATDAVLLEQLARDREVLTGRVASPSAFYVTRQIRALPVYDAAILDAQAALDELPANLAIAGNFLGRLGVSSLLVGAAEAADRLLGSPAGAAQATSVKEVRGTPIPRVN